MLYEGVLYFSCEGLSMLYINAPCHELSTQAKGGKVEVVQLRLFKAKERREERLYSSTIYQCGLALPSVNMEERFPFP